MRVLIDECVPHDVRHHLPGHTPATVSYMGWSGKKNGELLALMKSNRFEVLLTIDQSLHHQQNLALSGVAVVLLVAGDNELKDLVPLMPKVCQALVTIIPGDVVEIS